MAEIEQLVTDHLTIWTSAIERKSTTGRGRSKRVSLYGLEKLRSLILDLAVRGKLVSQNEGEEHANELLKRIASKRGGNHVRANNATQQIQKGAWKLPKGWVWTTLEQVTSYIQRGKGPNYDDAGSTLVLSQKCVQWSGLDLEVARRISDTSLAKYDEMRFLRRGDVLWNSTGTGTVGRAIVFEIEIEQRAVADSHLTLVRPLLVNPKFIVAYIASTAVQSRMQPDHDKPLVSGTTNQVELNTGSVRSLEFPLPPLAEQQRIVTKVDELMALCDALEACTYDALEAHSLLVKELLATLTASVSAEDFAQNWARIETHFDTLFTTEDSIDQLIQTILRLAVMGKLVPQDPSDEPASELLKQVRLGRAKAATEKKLRMPKAPGSEKKSPRPFDLPPGWQWATFPELGIFDRGRSKHRPRNDPKLFTPGVHPLVQTGEVARADEYIREFHSRYSDVGLAQSRMWPKGTLCITIAANIADSAILDFDACFPDSVVGFVPFKPITSSRYFLHFMKTAKADLLKYAPSTAQKNINVGILNSVQIPIPPLKEMIRIVEKVDSIAALCRGMKAHLDQAQNQQTQLADAVTARTLV